MKILLLTLGGGLRHAIYVYRELAELRLEVMEGGGVLINGVSVVGKGTNSVIFRCRPAVGHMELACKLRRGDATKDSLAAEGQLLHLANAAGVGPRIYVYARDVVAYRYVDGVHVYKWWKVADVEKKRVFLKELLDQAFRLDRAGISHNELARLERHVLVERDLPVIIDFESATIGGDSNVTQVANGLFRLGLKLPLEALRRYRRCSCEDAYREVLRFFLGQL